MASHRSTARFSAVLAVVVAIFGTGVVAGAAGSTMIIGSEANNAGAANTQLLTNSSVVAFKLLQNGPGTALMGYATPITGTTRGVYGRVDSPNGDGVQGRNAGPAGTGAAVRGYGGENAGAVLSSDADYPLELIGPANIAPMTVSSSIKVANLNADQLDGKDSTDFLLNETVTGHFPCAGFAMDPRRGGATETDVLNNGKYISSGAADSLTCNVILPDGATVVAVRGRVYDGSASYQASCSLSAISFADGFSDVMAATAGTGVAGTPGLVTVEDLSIVQPVIDNSLFAYVGQCALGGASASLRVHGYWVEYTIAGLPVV
jgi:hypothetical protein